MEEGTTPEFFDYFQWTNWSGQLEEYFLFYDGNEIKGQYRESFPINNKCNYPLNYQFIDEDGKIAYKQSQS